MRFAGCRRVSRGVCCRTDPMETGQQQQAISAPWSECHATPAPGPSGKRARSRARSVQDEQHAVLGAIGSCPTGLQKESPTPNAKGREPKPAKMESADANRLQRVTAIGRTREPSTGIPDLGRKGRVRVELSCLSLRRRGGGLREAGCVRLGIRSSGLQAELLHDGARCVSAGRG